MNDDLTKSMELEKENQRFYEQYPLAMLAIQTLKEITSRVSILEARIDAQHNRLVTIEEKIRTLEKYVSDLLRTSEENLDGNKKVLQLLNEHISTQNKDLRNLLFWIIVSLLSILGFGVSFLIQHITV